MFDDPNHPEMQALADHHTAGTHANIPADQAAAAVQQFHQQADPQMAQQVTDQHYEQMAPAQLQQAAQQLQDKIRQSGDTSAEATQLSQINPANASPREVATMHRFLSLNHPDQMRDALIAGGALAVTALAAFAAFHYVSSHRH